MVDAEGVGPQLLLLLGGVLVVAVLVLVVLRAPLFLQRVLLVLHVLVDVAHLQRSTKAGFPQIFHTKIEGLFTNF